MIEGASLTIAAQKQHLNDLNVFPVPDGDTGTNMTLTMGSGTAELKKKKPVTIGAAAEVTASALLRGARGNSGVILSLLFRGLSKGLKDLEEADTMAFASAMVGGVEAAYKAVMKPAEGTMLTVSRVASAAAKEFAASESDMERLLEHTLKVGYEALAQTTEQNPVLKKAGVVDSGGKGYLIILEGMLKALRGEEISAGQTVDGQVEEETVEFNDFSHEDITFTYCTEFIIGRENKRDPIALRDFLDGLGDSLVVVDDDEIIKVHVHTDVPGKVLTQALTYGSLLTIKIENMREQHAEMSKTAPTEPEQPQVAASEKSRGVVAISAGAGMESVFSDLGVDQIVTGGQTMNPCTDEIVRAIDAVPAETVYVLPNNKNIILAAQQAVPLAQKNVVLIPTASVPQGVAALMAFDPEMDDETNLSNMGEAVGRVNTIQITYASRDSEFDGQPIKEGEYLALLEGSILCSARDFSVVLEKTTETIQGMNPEFITLFYGQDVEEAAASDCAKVFEEQVKGAEVTVIQGGQPVYYYMISVE